MWHAWGRGKVFRGFWLVSPKVRDHWEERGVGGRIILRWILFRYGSMGRTEFSWLRIGSSGGFCEHGSIKKADVFDKLSDNQLFK
jgi:hypothetical protein